MGIKKIPDHNNFFQESYIYGRRYDSMENQSQPIQRSMFQNMIRFPEPAAIAKIQGGEQYPQIHGTVYFYHTSYIGVLVEAEVWGLPDQTSPIFSEFFAMHIHEVGDCTNNFANTGSHFNPTMAAHPNHAGDLPPLLSNHGFAWTAFYDERFILNQIIGKSVIIHSQPDDFRSQPSGNSGEKIACGVIYRS